MQFRYRKKKFRKHSKTVRNLTFYIIECIVIISNNSKYLVSVRQYILFVSGNQFPHSQKQHGNTAMAEAVLIHHERQMFFPRLQHLYPSS